MFLLYKMQSSTKSRVLDWTQSGRTFINRENNNGSKTSPYGTPMVTGILSEVNLLLALARFCR